MSVWAAAMIPVGSIAIYLTLAWLIGGRRPRWPR